MKLKPKVKGVKVKCSECGKVCRIKKTSEGLFILADAWRCDECNKKESVRLYGK